MEMDLPAPVTRHFTQGKFECEVTCVQVPLPPELEAAWWAGRKLLWQWILDDYKRIKARHEQEGKQ